MGEIKENPFCAADAEELLDYLEGMKYSIYYFAEDDRFPEIPFKDEEIPFDYNILWGFTLYIPENDFQSLFMPHVKEFIIFALENNLSIRIFLHKGKYLVEFSEPMDILKAKPFSEEEDNNV